MDCSPPGSSVRGILQTRILEWVAFPSPGDLPDPGIDPWSPALQSDSSPSAPAALPPFHGNDVVGRQLLSAAGGFLGVPDPTLDPCMIPQGEALRKAPSPKRQATQVPVSTFWY